jgi:hypothetical protein
MQTVWSETDAGGGCRGVGSSPLPAGVSEMANDAVVSSVDVASLDRHQHLEMQSGGLDQPSGVCERAQAIETCLIAQAHDDFRQALVVAEQE